MCRAILLDQPMLICLGVSLVQLLPGDEAVDEGVDVVAVGHDLFLPVSGRTRPRNGGVRVNESGGGVDRRSVIEVSRGRSRYPRWRCWPGWRRTVRRPPAGCWRRGRSA